MRIQTPLATAVVGSLFPLLALCQDNANCKGRFIIISQSNN